MGPQLATLLKQVNPAFMLVVVWVRALLNTSYSVVYGALPRDPESVLKDFGVPENRGAISKSKMLFRNTTTGKKLMGEGAVIGPDGTRDGLVVIEILFIFVFEGGAEED